MHCQDFENLLQPHADGELEEPEALDIEAHLADCPRCRAIVLEQRAFRRALRNAGRTVSGNNPAAPEALRARIGAGLEAETAPKRTPFWRRPAFAAAALLCLIAGGVLFSARQQSASRKQRAVLYARSAIANHRRALPLEVTGGTPSIQRWFHGKVDFAPRVPELRKVIPIGARLSNVSDRQAAYIAYDAKGDRRVSLFVFDAPDFEVSGGKRIADREVLLTNQQGYNVVLWKDREIAYSLVSDLDEQDILELVTTNAER